MDSSENYPSSLYRPPTCTFQDFCNGLDFKAFRSLYQQLNPHKSPALQYVQQHWIVLINELFPDTLNEKTQTSIVNAVGQELKFQAFAYENVGSVSARGKALMPAKQANLKCLYGGGKMVSVKEDLDAETQSFDAEREISNDERERSCTLRKYNLEYEASSLGACYESTDSSAIISAPRGTMRTWLREFHNGEVAGNLAVSGPNLSYVTRPYRGKRAGRKTRETSTRNRPDSVPSPVSDADTVVEDWALPTRVTAEVLTSNAEVGQVSKHQNSLNSPLEGLKSLRSKMWKFHHGVEHDDHSRTESLKSQRSGQQSSSITTDEWPEPIDPCSLSRAELAVAITELLRTIQSDLGTIHPDRLKKVTWV
jgi:hypothetical protein